jgi:hypothetical protein
MGKANGWGDIPKLQVPESATILHPLFQGIGETHYP